MRSLAVVGTAAALLNGIAGPAGAAPRGDTIPLDCGSAGTFEIFVNGNGEFTPGRDTASTTVLVPISFQNEHFVVTGPDGTVLLDETEDARLAKGRVAERSPRAQVDCSFTVSFVLESAEDGFPAGSTLSFSGEVTGYLTPAR